MITLYKLYAVNTTTNLRIEPRGYTPETRKPLYRQIESLVHRLNLGKEISRCMMIYGSDNTRRIYENGYIEIERKYVELIK